MPRPEYLTFDPANCSNAWDVARVLDATEPDCILFAGAMAFVDGCETEPGLAVRANAHGPSAVASYARAHGIKFAFFSSDYVFDGSPVHPGPYLESAQPNPLNVYGRSKLQGERATLRLHPEALILRTSWVYGTDAAGKNFLGTLLRQLAAGQRIRVPSDQISTPTYNRDLAKATLQLIAAGAFGVVHVTGPELMSRGELALRVASFFGLDSSLIEAVPTSELGQIAKRPLASGLVSERLGRGLPAIAMHTLAEALPEVRTAMGILE